jgi:hypothetical protein
MLAQVSLNPTREALRQHVLSLCERHDIVVHWCRRPARAKAIYEFEEITIAPVRSLTSYATAMHEIGHILGRYQRSRRIMVRQHLIVTGARRGEQHA